jgi:hypothetical protein
MARKQIEGSAAERWVSTASAYFVERVDDAETEAELGFGGGGKIGRLLTLWLRTVLEHCFGEIEDRYKRGVEFVPSKLSFRQVDVAQDLADEVMR